MSTSRRSGPSRGRRPPDRSPITEAELRFAAVSVGGEAVRVRRAARAARRAGVRRVALEEIALMLVLYAGYPAALEALRSLNEAWPPRVARRRRREGGPARWRRLGAALCRRVYGPNYARLVSAVRGLHPDLAAWMIEQGYGRVLSRPGLSARARELVTVAVLASLARERQLVSHLIGARRLGSSTAEVARALRAGLRGAAARPRAVAARAWRVASASALTFSGPPS